MSKITNKNIASNINQSFVIRGKKKLAGIIPVYGSKNAALPLLAAAVLTKQEIILHNIPDILDVQQMCSILQSAGARVSRVGSTITVQADKFMASRLDQSLVSHLRGSILLLGALLGRNKKVTLPLPGGDIIGARPIDVHLDAFEQLGAVVTVERGKVTIDGSKLKSQRIILREFSVTATENVLLVAATLPGQTTIEVAATEPHVVALAALLTQMGAKISGAGTHTIIVDGAKSLDGAAVKNISDMLEAGFFILMGAATQSEITVTNVPVNDLLLFFKKLDDIGVNYKIENNTVHIRPAVLKPFKMQSLPHPGIATDLQAPFSVVASQVSGSSLIHDPLYEGRFRHCQELSKMGASITVCDPHRVIIHGPTPLHGQEISSLDIRSGATLIMAGLIASGETTIKDAYIIDRGYEALDARLRAIGADIRRS